MRQAHQLPEVRIIALRLRPLPAVVNRDRAIGLDQFAPPCAATASGCHSFHVASRDS
jgi:hypothetical protein